MYEHLSNFEPIAGSNLWILIVSFIVAFFLAFGVGANDVANSFGTSVGSKVLTLRQACILATIFECLGSVLMGYNVSVTIRTGMIHIEQYNGQIKLLMLGYLAALIGSSVWNIIATLFGLPISGTHSIVGAIIGFSAVARGFSSVKWKGLIKIVASWFISPVLSGIVSLGLYLLISFFITEHKNSLERGLYSLPIFYSATVMINIFSIVHEGPHFFETFNWWMALCTSLSIGFVVGLVVWFYVVPRFRVKILKKLDNIAKLAEKQEQQKSATDEIEMKKVPNGTNETSPVEPKSVTVNVNGVSTVNGIKSGDIEAANNNCQELTHPEEDDEAEEDDDKPDVAQLFTFLQILTACFGAFAHGGNDVSNAIGPLVAVMMLFLEGHQDGETPWYILIFGGIGISIGLWVWGRKVIQTMGSDLTKITPSTGFTIEIGAAITVLMASKVGVPVSTTHCKVGSVVMVGKARKNSKVNWKLFGNISVAWIVTVPFTGLLSALSMFVLMKACM